MCLLVVLLLAFAGFFGFTGISSQTLSVPALAEVESPEVISCAAPSADQDISDMLALVGDSFTPTAWTQQISSDSAKTSATWLSDKFGAVAYLEYLHYDCGVSQEQIDQYYSPEGFEVLLSNYAAHDLTAECEYEGVQLFEFAAVLNDTDYHILYWVRQTSPTRVAGLMLVFPMTEQAQHAVYAGRLFPDLPTCEAAAG